jgi:hypothetical protein
LSTLLRNRLLGGALFAGLLFGQPAGDPPASGGGMSGKKSQHPIWVVGDKIFDNPWVAQEYLDSITRRDAPAQSELQIAQPQAPAQFLVLEDDRVEIDLTRFSYADEMARDMIEAHMKLAQIIIDERDMQVATLMAMAMLDD